MQTLGEKLKETRKKQNMSQQQLANLMGVSRVTIANYENGYNTATYKNLQKLSDILKEDFVSLTKQKVKTVPILSTASCGNTDINHLQEKHKEALYNGESWNKDLYCVVANGDSMAPEIEDGDEIICDPNIKPLNGDLVHYQIFGESAVKIYFKDEEGGIIQFVPYNSVDGFKTKTIRVDSDDIGELKISKVVAVNKIKFNNRLARLRMIKR